jgi:hypothetical protein
MNIRYSGEITSKVRLNLNSHINFINLQKSKYKLMINIDVNSNRIS